MRSKGQLGSWPMTTTLQQTHHIVLLDKKPSDVEIKKLTSKYYEEMSKNYDEFNEKATKRQLFLERVDSIITAELRKKKIQTLLSLCCGTGFREQRIVSELETKVKVTGVDSNEAMCFLALDKGLDMICGEWPEGVNRDSLQGFDAALLLHSLGASPSALTAAAEIKAIYESLKKSGVFFVDAMNIDDESEWGPEIKKQFTENHLAAKGYAPGDVFYKREDKSQVAFFHYYSSEELQQLGEDQGFQHFRTWYVGTSSNAGELVGKNEGAILMMFTK